MSISAFDLTQPALINDSTLRALTLQLPLPIPYPRNSRCAPRKLRNYHGSLQQAVNTTFGASLVRVTHSSIHALHPYLTASYFPLTHALLLQVALLHPAFHSSSPYPIPAATPAVGASAPKICDREIVLLIVAI